MTHHADCERELEALRVAHAAELAVLDRQYRLEQEQWRTAFDALNRRLLNERGRMAAELDRSHPRSGRRWTIMSGLVRRVVRSRGVSRPLRALDGFVLDRASQGASWAAWFLRVRDRVRRLLS